MVSRRACRTVVNYNVKEKFKEIRFGYTPEVPKILLAGDSSKLTKGLVSKSKPVIKSSTKKGGRLFKKSTAPENSSALLASKIKEKLGSPVDKRVQVLKKTKVPISISKGKGTSLKVKTKSSKASRVKPEASFMLTPKKRGRPPKDAQATAVKITHSKGKSITNNVEHNTRKKIRESPRSSLETKKITSKGSKALSEEKSKSPIQKAGFVSNTQARFVSNTQVKTNMPQPKRSENVVKPKVTITTVQAEALNLPKVIHKEPAPMTEYERQRLENIRANQVFMEMLNLGAGFGISASSLAPTKVTPTKAAVKPLVTKRKVEVVFNPRKSLRVQNKPAPAPLPLPETIESRKSLNPKKRPLTKIKSRVNWDLPVSIKRHDLEASQKGKKSPPKLAPKTELNMIHSLASLELLGGAEQELPSERRIANVEEILTKLNDLRLVTDPPTKIMHPIPTALDVHPDSRRLLVAMGNREGQVALWDATNLTLEKDVSNISNGFLSPEAPHFLYSPHDQPILGLKFQPGCPGRLLHGGGDGSLRAIDIVKGAETGVCQLSVPSESITGLDIKSATPNSAYFVTSHGFLGHHDLRTSGCASNLYHIEPSAMRLWCLAQNPTNPHLMAVGSSERTMSLWDLRYMPSNPYPITSLGFSASVTSLDWDLRGSRLVSLSYDHHLRFFDLQELSGGQETHSLEMTAQVPHHGDLWRKGVPFQARFHPDPALDGSVAASGAEGPQINFYSAPSGRSLGYYSGRGTLPAATPAVIAFHPSATLLGSSPLGSAIACGTLSGRVLILA